MWIPVAVQPWNSKESYKENLECQNHTACIHKSKWVFPKMCEYISIDLQSRWMFGENLLYTPLDHMMSFLSKNHQRGTCWHFTRKIMHLPGSNLIKRDFFLLKKRNMHSQVQGSNYQDRSCAGKIAKSLKKIQITMLCLYWIGLSKPCVCIFSLYEHAIFLNLQYCTNISNLLKSP